MKTVKHGGNLQIGDFIVVSNNNRLIFGWYYGDGKDTLQYFEYDHPFIFLTYYNLAKNDASYQDHSRANSEEFKIKYWIPKTYVKDWRYKVMKIEDPESIFTEQEDLNKYLESKQILEQIKFI